jgi:hypothetical protein
MTSTIPRATHRTSGAAESRCYILPIPPVAAAKFDRDRDAGHRFVMSLLPDGLGEETRSKTETVWRIGPTALEIITTADIPGFSGTPVGSVASGQRARLQLTLEAVRTKSSPVAPELVEALHAEGIRWRNRKGRIDDGELSAWIEAQLLKHGWKTVELREIHRRPVSRRRARMHLVECVVDVDVVEPIMASESLRKGIGRGRSFGAGMVTMSAKKKN